MDSIFLFIFSVSGFLATIYVAHTLIKSNLGVFHPVVILASLAAIDAFVPGVIWSFLGVPEVPLWKDQINEKELVIGLVYYIVFYLFMLVPIVYYMGSVKIRYHYINVHKNRLLWFLIAAFLLSCGKLWFEIDSEGGLAEWFWGKSKIRWVGAMAEDPEQGALVWILDKLPWRIIFSTLVLCAFYFRYQHNRKYLYGLIFPALAMLLSLTTFFRGSILLVLIGLAFVEFVRYKNITRNGPTTTALQITKIKMKARRVSRRLIIISVGFFLVFGVVRGYFESITWSVEPQYKSQLLQIFLQGSGIDGVGQIVRFYSEQGPYLNGKTYIDMMLLPIPRAIYTAKPEWYGIDDITRGMGWPESSQSAVTIPGEAFANFSWYGLIMAPIFGIMFAFLLRTCFGPGRGALLFLYPGVMFYIFFISNWMAFTGVMNQLLSFLCVYATLRVVSNKQITNPAVC